MKGGRLCHEQYRPPFDGVFIVSKFEYGTRVEVSGQHTNRWIDVGGRLINVGARDRTVAAVDVP